MAEDIKDMQKIRRQPNLLFLISCNSKKRVGEGETGLRLPRSHRSSLDVDKVRDGVEQAPSIAEGAFGLEAQSWMKN